jgi:hypothetical protein
VTIDTLPDVALLEIFDFYVKAQIKAWHRLVHVCRKWRDLIFASPRRLNLRLYCNLWTPVRKSLDIWPKLPIFIKDDGDERWGLDNIIAAFEHDSRVRGIDLYLVPSPRIEKALAAMQKPFPELTYLKLHKLYSIRGTARVVPASFLGGSAPSLEYVLLDRITFPGLPKLLLSATDLSDLHLWNIPPSGYILPEEMAPCLAVLTRLERLVIQFESPPSRLDQKNRRPPPPTRTVLAVLTLFYFKGVGEYLDELVAQIDAPLLKRFNMTFFPQLIFDTPQLAEFISRSPILTTHNEARLIFSDSEVDIKLPQTSDGALKLGISCGQLDQQASSLAQVCRSSFPPALISAVEHLYIDGYSREYWHESDTGKIQNNQWLELLLPFTAVKHLYVSFDFTPDILPFMKELVPERVTEVLPTLQTLFLEGPLPSKSAIKRLVAARRLSGHPIVVSLWEVERTPRF